MGFHFAHWYTASSSFKKKRMLILLGVMLSISRSRYSLLVQFVFLAVNGAGVLLSTIYNATTPDLYPNNAHHKVGWILTWITGAQVVLGVISAYTRRKDDRGAFIPVSTANIEQHQRIHDLGQAQMYRFSASQFLRPTQMTWLMCAWSTRRSLMKSMA
jgi:hypothetical protein